jgi:hypothetical protein
MCSVYTINVYMTSVGKGIAYPRMMGDARASSSGMSNSFESRAFSYMWLSLKM